MTIVFERLETMVNFSKKQDRIPEVTMIPVARHGFSPLHLDIEWLHLLAC